jgi:hypothetical protein
LPEILGITEDDKSGIPTINPSELRRIVKEYGPEGIKKLSEIVQAMQKHPELWQRKITNKDLPDEQLDLIRVIKLPELVNLKARPLKGGMGVRGRYDVGRKDIDDEVVNAIFANCLRDYSASKIAGMTTSVLYALDNPELISSKLRLYAEGMEKIQALIDATMARLEEPTPKPPERPEEEPELRREIEKELAKPEKPLEPRKPEIRFPEAPEELLPGEKPEKLPEKPEEPEIRFPEAPEELLPGEEKPEVVDLGPEEVPTPEKPRYKPPAEPKEAPKKAPEEEPEEKKATKKKAQDDLLKGKEE